MGTMHNLSLRTVLRTAIVQVLTRFQSQVLALGKLIWMFMTEIRKR